jgi:hypothetical protein
VTTTTDGDVIVVGWTTSALYSTSFGGNDMFIVKLRGDDGSIIWSRQYGATFNDFGRSVSMDPFGDFFVGGSTYNMFKPTTGLDEVFVAKYSGIDGSLLWGNQRGSTNQNDGTFGVSSDSHGDVFATGIVYGAVFGSYAGSGDIFVVKYSGIDGGDLWSFQIGTTSGDMGTSVAVDEHGDAVIAGTSQSSLFGKSVGTGDFVLFKVLSQSGEVAWTYQNGSTAYDNLAGVVISSENAVLAAGATNGKLFENVNGTKDYISISIYCNPGSFFDNFTCHYCPSGTFSDGSRAVVPECTPCSPGQHSSREGTVTCSECAMGTYTDQSGSVACDKCPGITYSEEASVDCPYFSFTVSTTNLIVVVSLFILTTAGLALYAGISFSYALVVTLSSGDILSDVAYILTATFHRRWLLLWIIFFTFLPAVHVPIVLYRLARSNQQRRSSSINKSSTSSSERSSLLYEFRLFFEPPPKLFPLLRVYLNDRIPYILNVRLLPAVVKKVDNLAAFFLYLFVMLFAVIYWLLWVLIDAIYYFPWAVVHIPYFVVVTVLGYYLMQVKLFAHPKIRNLFDRVCWIGDVNELLNSVDTKQINESSFFEVVLESIPQLVLQSINESYNFNGSELPTIFLVSVTMTSLVISTNLYRFIYWTFWIGVPLGSVPMLLSRHMSTAKRKGRGGDEGDVALMDSTDSRSGAAAANLTASGNQNWLSFFPWNKSMKRQVPDSVGVSTGEITPILKDYIDDMIQDRLSTLSLRMGESEHSLREETRKQDQAAQEKHAALRAELDEIKIRISLLEQLYPSSL